MISMAGVRLAMRRQWHLLDMAHVEIKSWANCMIRAIAAPAENLVQILEAKRQLMQGLSDEARRCARSISAAVRIYDASTRVYRSTACSGKAWTDELKTVLYRPGEPSAIVHAFETNSPFFVPNAAQEKHFRFLIPATKSLFAIPFGARDRKIGVLSVDWPRKLTGKSAPHREALLHLVRQFEGVFDVLDSREQDIRRRLVATLASCPLNTGDELEAIAQETVNLARAAFQARGCSIFLVFPGQDRAHLVATSCAKPSNPIWYAPGEGLTGFVLKYKRSVRLKNTGNRKEIRRIHPDLKPAKKWNEDLEYADAKAKGKQAFLAAPMLSKNRVIGVIRLTIKNDLSEFTYEEETLLLRIAREIGEAIDAGWDKAQVQEESKASLKQIQQLHQIGLGFAETPDFETLIKRVLATCLTESSMKVGVIRLLNKAQNGLVLEASEGAPQDAFPRELPLNPVNERALSSSMPSYIPDTRADQVWQKMLAAPMETGRKQYLETILTAIQIPIRLKDRAVGLLMLDSPDLVVVPTRVIGFLGVLGGYAAVAIELAQAKKRLEDELDTTRPLSYLALFVGGFVHEIINGINGCVLALQQMLTKSADQDYVEEKIGLVRADLRHVRVICDQLLEFAPDRAKIVMKPVRLKELLASTIVGLTRFNPKVNVQANLKDSGLVRGNAPLIRSAFANLMLNAAQAMPDGGALSITLRSLPDMVEVRFVDTGVGMDGRTREQCMNPFFTTKLDGRGLGLAAVYGIIQQHNGKISIESEVGKGSEFTLFFPRERVRK
jgi:signal transduction histidine kinase